MVSKLYLLLKYGILLYVIVISAKSARADPKRPLLSLFDDTGTRPATVPFNLLAASCNIRLQLNDQITQFLYKCPAIVKVRVINKIRIHSPSAFSNYTYSILFRVEYLYKNFNDNKLQQSSLIFIEDLMTSSGSGDRCIFNSSQISLNETYILFVDGLSKKNFYTLINFKSNRYYRESIPKLKLIFSPIKWDSANNDFINLVVCETCGKDLYHTLNCLKCFWMF